MLKSRYADKAEEQLHYEKGRETHFWNKGAKELPSLQKGDVVRLRPNGNKNLEENYFRTLRNSFL